MVTETERADLLAALRSSKPFTSADATQPRLLWHPQVHQHYGERCLYFVLRLRDLHVTDSGPAVDELLRQAGVGTYSVYLLYGVYDVLVRTWVTATARERLEALLDTNVAIVAEWEEFQVEQIRYLWAGPYLPLTSRLIETNRKSIETIAAFRGTASTAEEVLPVAEGLVDGRMLHLLPGRTRETIKFYVALQAQPGGGTRTRAVEDLAERLANAGLGHVSLYSGIGFAGHLIRCVAQDFGTILTTLEDLAPIAQQLKMRTTSMIIATVDVRESDVLLTNVNLANPMFAQISGVIGRKYETRLLDLPEDDQADISRVFRRYSPLLGTGCDDLFVALLRSVLDQDIRDLNRELSLLLHFELILKAYFERQLAAQLGESATVALAEVGASMPKYKSEVGQEPSIERLALGTSAQLLHRLSLDGRVTPPALLVDTLGESWAGVIEAFTKRIRNPLAHGHVFTETYRERFLREWRPNSELICEICILYTRLLEAVETDDE